MKLKLTPILLTAATMLVAGCSSTMTKHDKGYVGGHKPLGDVKGPVPGSSDHFKQNTQDRVHFDFAKSDIRSDAEDALQGQATWLQEYPSADLLIEGHCDKRGTREFNMALGERRAMAVKKHLMSKGISDNRLHIVSYGKERLPAGEGDTEDTHKENRVGISVLQ